MNKKISLTTFSILGFLAAVCLLAFFLSAQFLYTGASDSSEEVVFEVLPGQGMNLVADRLEKEGLIKNAWVFSRYSRLIGEAPNLKRGEYALRKNMTPNEILNVVTSGKSIARNLTFAEGLNIFDIASMLEKAGYGTYDENLNLMMNPEFVQSLLGEPLPSLEGYLFPETYQVTRYDSVKDILAQMVNRFLAVWKDFEPLAADMGWTRHQAVTFASLVEKETGAHSDRPLVSAVFHNRFKKKMRLQTDPTVLYGRAVVERKMPINITRADLQTPTPYNTYTIMGLPPTPISNPGRQSFEAAFRPAPVSYLYFVSRNDGTTHFSETYAEHNRAVQEYQLNSKNRDGRSWRDLQQKNQGLQGP